MHSDQLVQLIVAATLGYMVYAGCMRIFNEERSPYSSDSYLPPNARYPDIVFRNERREEFDRPLVFRGGEGQKLSLREAFLQG